MDEKKQEALANYLLDNINITRITNRYVWVGKERSTRKQFSDLSIKFKVLKAANCIDALDMTRSEQDDFYGHVLDLCQQFIRDDMEAKYVGGDTLPPAELDRSLLTPLLDIRNNNIILFNSRIKGISEIDYKAWEMKIPQEEKEMVYKRMKDVILDYDPYVLETFIPVEFEGMEVLKVNTYAPPKWRLEPPPAEIECPEEIEIVLSHLFPDPLCREFVLNWMYTALIGRNETYLVLNGKKGVGKGVFETLLAALVGREHYTEAPPSILTGDFNASLDKKRLVVMDEFKVGKKEHTRLKRFINKWQSIEKKGIDADKATETYNSFVISNNDVTDMFIETDDRRFSVPDLANTPLTDVLHMEDIELLNQDLENNGDIVTEFGYYIYERGASKRFDQFSAWKGERFWDLAFNSLYEWQKFIADKIFSTGEEEYNLGTLNREFSKDSNNKFARFPRNPKKIGDFLNNYLHKGEYRLGTVEKVAGENTIVTDKKWHQEQDDEEESYL